MFPLSCFDLFQVAKRFELCTSTSFGDSRLTLVHEDAAEFVKREVSHKFTNPNTKFAVATQSKAIDEGGDKAFIG